MPKLDELKELERDGSSIEVETLPCPECDAKGGAVHKSVATMVGEWSPCYFCEGAKYMTEAEIEARNHKIEAETEGMRRHQLKKEKIRAETDKHLAEYELGRSLEDLEEIKEEAQDIIEENEIEYKSDVREVLFILKRIERIARISIEYRKRSLEDEQESEKQT